MPAPHWQPQVSLNCRYQHGTTFERSTPPQVSLNESVVVRIGMGQQARTTLRRNARPFDAAIQTVGLRTTGPAPMRAT